LRRTSLSKYRQKIRAWERKGSPIDPGTLKDMSHSLNSYPGMLRQVNGYNARKSICRRVESLFLQMDSECNKIKPGADSLVAKPC
jgi:hypothetical protein